MGNTMHQAVSDFFPMQFDRQPLEENLPQIYRYRARGLQNLGELCVSQSDHSNGALR